MKFMMMVKAGKDFEDGKPHSPELGEAIGRITEEMRQKGILVGIGGLTPSSAGSRVKVKGGKLTVIDGPFTETKELIGGYAIMEVPSMEEAVELARRFMQIHADVMGPSYEGELEIRPLAVFDQA